MFCEHTMKTGMERALMLALFPGGKFFLLTERRNGG